MKRTDKQKKSRKPTEVRRQEIINAAMQILTAEGARRLTADRLGAAVGIASGTIFRHFVSMEEILDGIVDTIEEIIFKGFPPPSDNPMESLRLFFESRVKAISEHPEVSRLLLTSTLIPNSGNKNRENRLREFKLRSRRFVVDCLKNSKAEGLLAQDISPEDSSVLILGAIYAIGHMGIGTDEEMSDGDLAHRVWRILERSLTQKGDRN